MPHRRRRQPIQSGGFGSFSKNYGLASAALLEAEIVTADGVLRVAKPCTDADLFWAIKGGGGLRSSRPRRASGPVRSVWCLDGSRLGRRRPSRSDRTDHSLLRRQPLNPHWGEQIIFERHSNAIRISKVFQGLVRQQAESIWKPFLDALALRRELSIEHPFTIATLPARHAWNPAFLAISFPDTIIKDDRPDALASNVFWAGDQGQVAQFLHAYKSAWLPAALLENARRQRLVDALFATSRHWQVSLHVNKGLAGAPSQEVEAARDTAMNPDVLDAFALAIIASNGPPAFPGMAGHEPDIGSARARADAVGRAMDALRAVAPKAGSYLSESDFFERDWQRAFWETNYPRLADVKRTYDPEGPFFVHHGVGSEEWSSDGFTRRPAR